MHVFVFLVRLRTAQSLENIILTVDLKNGNIF